MRISDGRYAKTLQDNLWIISEENIKKVLSRIEQERGIVLKKEYKKTIIDGFKANLAMINGTLEKTKAKRI